MELLGKMGLFMLLVVLAMLPMILFDLTADTNMHGQEQEWRRNRLIRKIEGRFFLNAEIKDKYEYKTLSELRKMYESAHKENSG